MKQQKHDPSSTKLPRSQLPPPPSPPPPVVVVPRTSVTYYYLALSGILLGVILLILYAVCFRHSMLMWTGVAFVFGIAFGVIAVYQIILEEGERLFVKLSSKPALPSLPPRPPIPPVVIEDVEEEEGEY